MVAPAKRIVDRSESATARRPRLGRCHRCIAAGRRRRRWRRNGPVRVGRVTRVRLPSASYLRGDRPAQPRHRGRARGQPAEAVVDVGDPVGARGAVEAGVELKAADVIAVVDRAGRRTRRAGADLGRRAAARDQLGDDPVAASKVKVSTRPSRLRKLVRLPLGAVSTQVIAPFQVALVDDNCCRQWTSAEINVLGV